MVRTYLNSAGLMLTGLLGFAFHGAAQEMKILREMDRDPMVAGQAAELLQHPAGDIGPVMKSPGSIEVKDGPAVLKEAPKEKLSAKPVDDSSKATVTENANKSGSNPEVSATSKASFTLGVIDGESDDNSTVVTIRLDKAIDWKEVALENHNTYLQIPLPRTIVPESGKFIDIKSPYITKAALFQVTPDRGAVRLFLSREFAALESSLHADILGDRIVITLDHNILEKNGVFDHVQKNGVKGTPQVSEVIAKTQVRNDIPDPATAVKFDKEVGSKEATIADNLQQKTKLVAIISASIFVLFIGFSMAKSLLIRLRTPKGQENEYVMKTIASSHLAPKHKLTLMQIGDERILLSVSPDGIKYLTTIGAKEASRGAFPAISANLDSQPARYQDPMAKRPLLAGAAAAYKGTVTKPTVGPSSEAAVARRPVSSRPAVEESELTLDSRGARGKRVNAVISDEGIRDMRNAYRDGPSEESSHATKAIEDVTTLIRKKIKNLPTF